MKYIQAAKVFSLMCVVGKLTEVQAMLRGIDDWVELAEATAERDLLREQPDAASTHAERPARDTEEGLSRKQLDGGLEDQARPASSFRFTGPPVYSANVASAPL